MKNKNLLIASWIISLMLLFSGCNNEVDNVAMSADGVKISFDMQGKGMPALILIHGWGNNRSIWDSQVSHFSEKYKVIAVDLPGFGESGNNRQDWTMASFGEDVASIIKKLKLKQVVLVGFSMGGPVAIETSNIIPGQVKGIVLVDNLQDVEVKYPPPVISYIDSMMMDLVENPSNEKLVGGGFYKNNPEIAYERILSMLNGTSKTGWRESLNDFLIWSNEDMTESLKKCQVPIIAINSDMEPTNIEAFRKLVPSFQAKIVPDVGHVIMWDAPDQFNDLLEDSIQDFMK